MNTVSVYSSKRRCQHAQRTGALAADLEHQGVGFARIGYAAQQRPCRALIERQQREQRFAVELFAAEAEDRFPRLAHELEATVGMHAGEQYVETGVRGIGFAADDHHVLPVRH
jgi:hypothetical protein